MENVVAAAAITLRLAEAADEDFLLAVYASTRAAELALVPWNEDQKKQFVRMQFVAQRDHYRTYIPEGEQYVILCDRRAVGRLWIARKPEEIKILDITILPKDRNRGIGGQLLAAVLREAAETNKPVTIYVEDFNPSHRFFERLGFVAAEKQGMHVLMKWTPHKER